MPSSHSATVCALTTAAALEYGAGSFEFAVSFVLAALCRRGDANRSAQRDGKTGKAFKFHFDGKSSEAQCGGPSGET